MIILDSKKCAGCNRCAAICHHKCIHMIKRGGKLTPEIDYAYCSTCTQCIAICPQKALSWDGCPSTSFENDQLPAAGQIQELFQQRRSTRLFKKENISREELEEIVSSGGFAPTNNFHLRAILIDDPEIFKLIDIWVMADIKRIYRLVFKRDLTYRILQAFSKNVNDVMRAKLSRGLGQGTSFETTPAAIILIAGDARVLLSEASAQFAAYNMILLAQAKGYGSRMMGAASTTLDKNKDFRKLMRLSRHERILNGFEIGVPAVSFRNKVNGKPFPLEFISRENC